MYLWNYNFKTVYNFFQSLIVSSSAWSEQVTSWWVNNIEKVLIKRTRKGVVKHKSASYKYAVISVVKRIPAYKTALVNLYHTSRKKVEIIKNKIISGAAAPLPDKRGKHNVKSHKIIEDVKESVIEHIFKFPAEEPHYSWNCNIHKKYLSPLLPISKMHK